MLINMFMKISQLIPDCHIGCRVDPLTTNGFSGYRLNPAYENTGNTGVSVL